ncbi:MAG TPA: carboxypeptidase regulatory-like domain-containing protein [Planctomycetota bacterium]
MKRAILALAVGAALLAMALRARRERPVRPAEEAPRPAPPAVVELSTHAEEAIVVVEPPAALKPPPLPRPAPSPPVVEATPSATGAIWGVVTLMGERPPRKRVKAIEADPACAALHGEALLSDEFVVDAEKRVRWAVVHVVKGLGERRFEPPTVPVQLEQVGCRYVPHVLGVRVDQPVAIVNRDPLLHNVHGLPFVNREFNFGQLWRSENVRAFARPEIFQVKCDVHPWMSAWLAVFDHPFFAISGEDGVFRIPGLPPGRYEIAAWHEELKTETREVDVGVIDARLDFLLQRR